MWPKFLQILLTMLLLVNIVYCKNGICSYRWGMQTPVCCDGYMLVSKYSYYNNHNYECVPICDKCDDSIENCERCKCPSGTKVLSEGVIENRKYLCQTECSPTCLNGICNMGTCLCHKGYESSRHFDLSSSVLRDFCKPVCKLECIDSDCTAPDTCTCHANYKRHTNEPNRCVPVCNKCTNGDCVEPDLCRCHEGFKWDDNITDCKPFCKSDCFNGECIMPDHCACHNGYSFDHHHDGCLPVCDWNCENAECVAPGYCKCHKNFKKHPSKKNICVPICEPECINSLCTAPNKCSCLPNYTRNNTVSMGYNDCQPVCEKCNNGQCIEPGKCVCDSGYIWDDSVGDCKPECQPPCINSTCVKPSECKCEEGFKKLSISGYICEPYSDCENDCSLPAIPDNNSSNNSTSFICKEEGYTLDNTGERCQPVCHPSCINSKCIAPDTCLCGKAFYKPSLNNESHICSLKPCKRDDNIINNIIKVSSENNDTCFDLINSPVLKLFDNSCTAEFTNSSCYDMLCINNDYEVCNMTYVCNIVSDDMNVYINDTRCIWINNYEDTEDISNNSFEVRYFTMRGETILHRYINEQPCLSCLCPVRETRKPCLNDTITFRLCDCPKDVYNSGLSEFSSDQEIVWISIIVFGSILLLCGIVIVFKKFIFTKNHSDKYKVEAFINNAYGINEDICTNECDENVYNEIPD